MWGVSTEAKKKKKIVKRLHAEGPTAQSRSSTRHIANTDSLENSLCLKHLSKGCDG